MTTFFLSKLRRKNAMTLIEVLLVVSIVSGLSLALYNGLSMGIKVWERSRVAVKEEDIVIFFDKLTNDLHNSYLFAKIPFQGGESRLIFPTIVLTPADRSLELPEGELIEQTGQVEYYHDILDDTIYRREFNYSQTLNQSQPKPRAVLSEIDGLKFRYFYVTPEGDLYSSDFLDAIPMGIEVEVQFSNNTGQKSFKKYIDIPIGG